MGTGVDGEMPADQRFDDGLSLCFDSDGLTEAVEILGNPVLTLRLRSDHAHAQLAARLCDVAPDGSSLRVSYGVLNLCHRDDMEHPTPLVPGEPVRIRLVLKMCGYRVPAGHRIRLALSTSYWPLLWPAREPATLTIASAGSALTLPVRAGGDAVELAPPRHGPFAPATRLDAGHVGRSVSFDMITGTATYVTTGRGGLFGEGVIRWEQIGISLSHDLERRLTVGADDPLSATSVVTQTYRMTGAGFAIRIESVTAMTGTFDAFAISGTLNVFEGEGLVHSREWSEHVPRSMV